MTRAQLTNEEWKFVEPYLPIDEFGPYPERLRKQFAGVIWRFRTGSQWREMPERFGAWQTVCNRFTRWRDAGVFQALLEDAVAEAARRGEIDLSLVSIDSTTARAHHDAAGMRLDEEVMAALEEAALEEERARQKGERRRDRTGRTVKASRNGPSGGDGRPASRPPSSGGPTAGCRVAGRDLASRLSQIRA